MKAILIHGLHLQANGWQSVVWGEPENNKYGIVPRAIEVAYKENADLIYWGSGASEKDGLKESEFTFNFAIKNINILSKICNTSPEILEKFLIEKSYLDKEAKNTKEEIDNFLNLCLERKIEKVAFVNLMGATPITSRRVLLAISEKENFKQFRKNFEIISSDTQYPDTSMEDIIIFAPPHRGDRLANPSHLLARKTLDVIQKQSKSLDKEALQKFMTEWENLLNKYSE